MAIDAHTLTRMIDAELSLLTDSRVVAHVRTLLVEPTILMRHWEYGRKGERYPCWTVLRHPASSTDIAYCEQGFGPSSPWGLVFSDTEAEHASIGMDCGWYKTFLQAYLESFAAADLPIWRVFKREGTAAGHPITDEGEWDATWEKVMALRESDPANQYDCSTSIGYPRD
jgi:hypothetical protein